jgi:hypothetical protein
MARRRSYTPMSEEQRQAREAELNAKRTNDFREEVARAQSLIVFEDRLLWRSEEQPDRSLQALYEIVHDFRMNRDRLKREIERTRDAADDALKRLEDGQRPNWSTILFNSAAECEQLVGALSAGTAAIARFAWAAGYYVAELYDVRYRARFEILRALRVEPDADGRFEVLGLGDRFGSVRFATADVAWEEARLALG